MSSHKIQLTIDKDLDKVLSKMKTRFPVLKEGDLLRMAASGFYSQNKHLFDDEVEHLDDKTSELVEQAKHELKTTNSSNVFSTGKSLLNFIKKSK
jgi:hypothetical protein